jgi:hypothetical protein
MKKAILFIPVLLCFNIKAQDTSKRFELGSTLVAANTLNYYYYQEHPRFEFMNTLFFRYKLCSRFSLRASGGYSEYNFSTEIPPYIVDGGGMRSFNKDFRISGGAQFSFFKTNEFLYTFADVNYRNVFSKGFQYGDWGGSEYNFTKTTNGFDTYLGLGSKIPLCKSVYLSPEIFFCISHAQQKGSLYPIFSGPAIPYSYSYTNSNAGARLHLTVKF